MTTHGVGVYFWYRFIVLITINDVLGRFITACTDVAAAAAADGDVADPFPNNRAFGTCN